MRIPRASQSEDAGLPSFLRFFKDSPGELFKVSDMLKECHRQALEHVNTRARSRRESARAELSHIWVMCDLPTPDLDRVFQGIRQNSQVALHFHPDRFDAQGQMVVQSLLQTGIYKSQFETAISAGSVSAWPGGVRYEWERRLFGGAYEQAEASDRPKYGALNLLPSPDGPAPRFGSSYLLLNPDVSQRCTFTYGDSHLEPQELGTLEEFEDILAALFKECFTRNFALGFSGLRPGCLLGRLMNPVESRDACRNLDHYIEAQVHGPIHLQDHAQVLVADRSFQGSAVGESLQGLSETYDLELRWHRGFSLDVHDVPSDFRGAVMPKFARRVAAERLSASGLGLAELSLREQAEDWEDFGEPKEVTQLIKRLWHILVKFGRQEETDS